MITLKKFIYECGDDLYNFYNVQNICYTITKLVKIFMMLAFGKIIMHKILEERKYMNS